jgi:hypothetical protein
MIWCTHLMTSGGGRWSMDLHVSDQSVSLVLPVVTLLPCEVCKL